MQELNSGEPVSQDDQKFLQDAAYINLGEIELNRAAEEQASVQNVRAFASRMKDEHIVAWKKLDSLARNEKVKLPDTPNQAHKAMIQYLQTLSGIAFDTTYINSQVADHRSAINLFTNAQRTTDGEEVQIYVAKCLPLLQQRLDAAQQLLASLKASPMTTTGR